MKLVHRGGITSAALLAVTSTSRFGPGLDNQGTVFGHAHDPDTGYWNGKLNAAYAVGFEWAAPYELRHYFSFDHSSLTPGSATGALVTINECSDVEAH